MSFGRSGGRKLVSLTRVVRQKPHSRPLRRSKRRPLRERNHRRIEWPAAASGDVTKWRKKSLLNEKESTHRRGLLRIDICCFGLGYERVCGGRERKRRRVRERELLSTTSSGENVNRQNVSRQNVNRHFHSSYLRPHRRELLLELRRAALAGHFGHDIAVADRSLARGRCFEGRPLAENEKAKRETMQDPLHRRCFCFFSPSQPRQRTKKTVALLASPPCSRSMQLSLCSQYPPPSKAPSRRRRRRKRRRFPARHELSPALKPAAASAAAAAAALARRRPSRTRRRSSSSPRRRSPSSRHRSLARLRGRRRCGQGKRILGSSSSSSSSSSREENLGGLASRLLLLDLLPPPPAPEPLEQRGGLALSALLQGRQPRRGNLALLLREDPVRSRERWEDGRADASEKFGQIRLHLFVFSFPFFFLRQD